MEIGPAALIEIEEVCALDNQMGMETTGWMSALGQEARIPQQCLYNYLRSSVLVPEIGSCELKRMKTEVRSPISNLEYPVSVVAGTIHKIPFEAVVEGACDVRGQFDCSTILWLFFLQNAFVRFLPVWLFFCFILQVFATACTKKQ